jgi:hypothetical protein
VNKSAPKAEVSSIGAPGYIVIVRLVHGLLCVDKDEYMAVSVPR